MSARRCEVTVRGAVSQRSLGALVWEIFAHALYQRGQLPLPYPQLLHFHSHLAVEDAVCLLQQLSVHILYHIPDVKGSRVGRVGGGWGEAASRSFTMKRGSELLYQPDTVSCYVSLLQQSHNTVILQAATSTIYSLASGDTEWSALARTVVAHNGGLLCLVEQLRSDHQLLAFTSVHALRVLARNDPNNQRLIGLYNGVRILTVMLPDVGEGGEGGDASRLGENGVSAVLWALTVLVSGSAANAQRLQGSGGIGRVVAIRTSRTAWSQDVFAARALLTALWAHRKLHASYKNDGWDREHFLS
ncbi:plakophilin-4-like [Petromyzon marinus]|uniref:plakophilin-4-like n=1 Tax=Petromyzon marinus TaxID=7757 RepID=UPI003F72AEDD